jgi:hypothetical protein
MEATCSYEILVDIQRITSRYIPEDSTVLRTSNPTFDFLIWVFMILYSFSSYSVRDAEK